MNITPKPSENSPKRIKRITKKPSSVLSSFQLNEALANADIGNELQKYPATNVRQTRKSSTQGFVPDYNIPHTSSSSTTVATVVSANSSARAARSRRLRSNSMPDSQRVTRLLNQVKYDRETVSTDVLSNLPTPSIAEPPIVDELNPRETTPPGVAPIVESSNMAKLLTMRTDDPLRNILERAETALTSLQSLRQNFNSNRNATKVVQMELVPAKDDYHPGRSIEPASYQPQTLKRSIALASDILLNAREGTDSAGTVQDCYNNQLNLLLSGIADAFDDNPAVDDDTVRRLLEEGGHPPSQVVFPSLYSCNQRLLAKLQRAKILRITISKLHISSVRFAVRRKGSSIRITLPTGSIESSITQTTPLKELELPATHRTIKGSSDALDKYKTPHAILAERYFGGDIELNKTVEFNVQINNEVVKTWLEDGSALGSIKIELISALSPAVSRKGLTRTQQGSLEPIVFGSLLLPLRGLLCSDELDALTTCQLIADPTTLASVLLREQSMPNGRLLARGGPLGNVVGHLTARISVLSDSEVDDPTIKLKSPGETLFNGLPKIFEDKSKYSIPPDYIHEALNYVPVDLEKTKENRRSSPTNVNHYQEESRHMSHLTNNMPIITRADDALEPTSSHVLVNDQLWSIVVLAVVGTRPSIIPSDCPFTISVSYKVSISENVVISGSEITIAANQLSVFDFFGQYQIHSNRGPPPVCEVWVSVQNNTGISRKLLGFANLANIDRSAQVMRLPISLSLSDNVADNDFGVIVTICRAETIDLVQQMAEQSIEVFSSLCKRADLDRKEVVRDCSGDDFRGDVLRGSIDTNCSRDSLLDVAEVICDTEMLVNRTDRLQIKPSEDDEISLPNLDQSRIRIESDEDIVPRAGDTVPTALPYTKQQMDNNAEHYIDQTVHIIDFTIEGTCSWKTMDGSRAGAGHVDYSIGCYVCYQLNVDLAVETEPHYLWYDSDCSVLNGSKRHRLSVGTNTLSLLDSIFPTKNDEEAPLQSLEFFLVHCNIDGALPARIEDRTVFGKCTLIPKQVNDIFVANGGSKTIQLPITMYSKTSPPTATMLTLTIYHRVEPILARSSSKLLLEVLPSATIESLSQMHAEEPLVFSIPPGVKTVHSTHLDNKTNLVSLAEDQTVLRSEDIKSLLPSISRLLEGDAMSVGVSTSFSQHIPPNSLRDPDPVLSLESSCQSTVTQVDRNLHMELQLRICIECVRDIPGDWGLISDRPNSVFVIGNCGSQEQVVGLDFATVCPGVASFSSSVQEMKAAITWDEVYDVKIIRQSSYQDEPVNADLGDIRHNSYIATRGLALVLVVYGRQHWRMPVVNAESGQPAVQVGDIIIGSAVIDLSLLALGWTTICGWYQLVDRLQQNSGLVKVTVTPLKQSGVWKDEFRAIDGEVRESLEAPITNACSVANLDKTQGSDDETTSFSDILSHLEDINSELKSKLLPHESAAKLLVDSSTFAPLTFVSSRFSSPSEQDNRQEDIDSNVGSEAEGDIVDDFDSSDLPYISTVNAAPRGLALSDDLAGHDSEEENELSGDDHDEDDDEGDHEENDDDRVFDFLDESIEDLESKVDLSHAIHGRESVINAPPAIKPTSRDSEDFESLSECSVPEDQIPDYKSNMHGESALWSFDGDSKWKDPEAVHAISLTDDLIEEYGETGYRQKSLVDSSLLVNQIMSDTRDTANDIMAGNVSSAADDKESKREDEISWPLMKDVEESDLAQSINSVSDGESQGISFNESTEPDASMLSLDSGMSFPHSSKIKDDERILDIGIFAGVDEESSATASILTESFFHTVAYGSVPRVNPPEEQVLPPLDERSSVIDESSVMSIDSSHLSEIKSSSLEISANSTETSQSVSFKSNLSEESSTTLKIRGIVEKEVQKAFQQRESGLMLGRVSISVVDHTLPDSFLDHERTAHQLVNQFASSNVDCQHSGLPLDSVMKSSQEESHFVLPESVLQRLEANRLHYRSTKVRLPGHQHRFIESETERISKIMLGTM